jgi:hypothetical protein
MEPFHLTVEKLQALLREQWNAGRNWGPSRNLSEADACHADVGLAIERLRVETDSPSRRYLEADNPTLAFFEGQQVHNEQPWWKER